VHLVDHILIFILFAFQPVYGYFEGRRYEARAKAGELIDRVVFYRQTMWVEWALLVAQCEERDRRREEQAIEVRAGSRSLPAAKHAGTAKLLRGDRFHLAADYCASQLANRSPCSNNNPVDVRLLHGSNHRRAIQEVLDDA
jgi:hypothetical protein